MEDVKELDRATDTASGLHVWVKLGEKSRLTPRILV